VPTRRTATQALTNVTHGYIETLADLPLLKPSAASRDLPADSISLAKSLAKRLQRRTGSIIPRSRNELTKRRYPRDRRARRALRPAGWRLSAAVAQKAEILRGMASELVARTPALLAANADDLARAEANGFEGCDRPSAPHRERIAEMADGVRQVADLNDPVGEILREWTRPNGIRITKIRTPIGVIGIIYESRPNVTSDAAVLCLKTGNAVILREVPRRFPRTSPLR